MRVRIAAGLMLPVLFLLGAAPGAAEEPPAGEPPRAPTPVPPRPDPMEVFARWAVREVARELGGARPLPTLDAWFDGGPGVPLAGLRDALVAAGWDAPSLRRWLLQRVVEAALGLYDALEERADGRAARPRGAKARGRWGGREGLRRRLRARIVPEAAPGESPRPPVRARVLRIRPAAQHPDAPPAPK